MSGVRATDRTHAKAVTAEPRETHSARKAQHSTSKPRTSQAGDCHKLAKLVKSRPDPSDSEDLTRMAWNLHNRGFLCKEMKEPIAKQAKRQDRTNEQFAKEFGSPDQSQSLASQDIKSRRDQIRQRVETTLAQFNGRLGEAVDGKGAMQIDFHPNGSVQVQVFDATGASTAKQLAGEIADQLPTSPGQAARHMKLSIKGG